MAAETEEIADARVAAEIGHEGTECIGDIEAAEAAISNPLLDDVSMKGARGVLINITGGLDMTLFEVDQAANRIREEVDPEAQIKVGSTLGEGLDGKIRVSVIATGIDIAAGSQRSSSAAAGAAGLNTAALRNRVAPKVQTAPAQTSYAQPSFTPTAATATPVQQVTPSVSAQTSYFTMPQAVAPHATVPHQTTPVETARPEPEEMVQAIEPEQDLVEEKEIIEREQPRAVEQSHSVEREEPQSYQAQQHTQTSPITGRSSRPASPMTPIDMRMTNLSAQTGQPTGSEQRRQRRAESLFTRITGFGLVRPSTHSHDDENQETQIHDEHGSAQEHLDVRHAEHSPRSSDQQEDLLEIPAFLRRQSNH